MSASRHSTAAYAIATEPEIRPTPRALRTPRIRHPAALRPRIAPFFPDDVAAIELERRLLARPGASIAIPIPGAIDPRLVLQPLPLDALYELDRHDWDSEKNVLAKWASGVGVGRLAVVDTDIVPGSPPRCLR